MAYTVKTKKIQYKSDRIKNSDTVTQAHLELYRGLKKIGDVYYSSKSASNTLVTFIKDGYGDKFHSVAKKFAESSKVKTVHIPLPNDNYILWYATYLSVNYFDHIGWRNKVEYIASGEAFGWTVVEFNGKSLEESR